MISRAMIAARFRCRAPALLYLALPRSRKTRLPYYECRDSVYHPRRRGEMSAFPIALNHFIFSWREASSHRDDDADVGYFAQ